MRELVIGLDIGSSSTKGILVDRAGKLLASGSRNHETTRLHPGWQEQDALSLWWEECIGLIRELQVKAGTKPAEIRRIGVTGFVPGLCLPDAQGNPVRPGILHTDTRAEEELASIRRLYPEVHHGLLLPKLLWVKNHESERFRSAVSALVPHSFIVFKLTGKTSCDHDSASIYGALFDEKKLRWDSAACAEFGIPEKLLPEPLPATSKVGQLTTTAAGLTGLATSTEVIVGTGDSFASLLGTGIRDAHELMLYWGTSGTRIYTRDSPARYLDGPYFNGGKAEFTGTIFSCGESLNLVKNLLGDIPWKVLDAQAEAIQPGAENLFYFPHLKQQASSVSLVSADHIIGLRDKHGAGHLHRALLEGIAYTSVMELSALERIDKIHVCGGAASCKELRTILATLMQKPVHYSPDSSAALGIALLASLSLQDSASFSQVSQDWFQKEHRSVSTIQEPREEWIEVYKQKMEAFSSLKKGLLSIQAHATQSQAD